MEQLLLAANTSSAKAGKAKVGRKQKEILPVDEKQKKSLEAQRAFRERRSHYVASLEKEVAELKAVIDGKVPLSNDTEVELLRQQLLAVTAENSLMRQSSIQIDFKSTVPSSASAMVAGIDCVGCSVEKLKTLLCMGQIKTLESKLTELTNENQVLKSIIGSYQNPYLQSFIHSNHSTSNSSAAVNEDSAISIGNETPVVNNGDGPMDIESIDARSFQTRSPSDFDNELNSIFGTNSNNNIDSNNLHAETPLTQISSTELYGPPECEFARIAFNSIPSIRNSKYIDELFNVFNAASSCVDVDRIRKYRIRLLRARGKLLDSCAVLDRQKVIEIFVMFIERNKRHTEHRAWLGSHLPSLDDNDIYYRSAFVNFKDTAASLRFKESLLEIPSLKGFETDIHKLAVLLWTPSPNGKENEVWDWISTVKKSLIARLQTIEEKTKWTMTIENQRYSRDKSFKDPVYDLTDQVVSDDEI